MNEVEFPDNRNVIRQSLIKEMASARSWSHVLDIWHALTNINLMAENMIVERNLRLNNCQAMMQGETGKRAV